MCRRRFVCVCFDRAARRDFREKLGGFVVLLVSRPPQPDFGRANIRRRSAPGQIHSGEVELCAGMVLFSGGLHPFEGQEIVLRYAASNPIERGQPVLCFRVSRLRELAKRDRGAAELCRTNGVIDCIQNSGFVAGDLCERRGTVCNKCGDKRHRTQQPVRGYGSG